MRRTTQKWHQTDTRKLPNPQRKGSRLQGDAPRRWTHPPTSKLLVEIIMGLVYIPNLFNKGCIVQYNARDLCNVHTTIQKCSLYRWSTTPVYFYIIFEVLFNMSSMSLPCNFCNKFFFFFLVCFIIEVHPTFHLYS